MLIQDLLFYSLYIVPFVVLARYRDETSVYLLKVSCANALMLFYMISDHIGLLILYLSSDGVKQLNVIDRDTVILLAFYSIVVTLAYVTTGKALGRKYSSIRIPVINVLENEKIDLRFISLLILIASPIVILKILDDSPLLLLLAGSATEATVLRVENAGSASLFLGIKSSYLEILFSLLAFASEVCLVAAFVNREIKHYLYYIIIIAIISLYWLANVSKGIVVFPIYSILLVYSLVYQKGVIFNRTFWLSFIPVTFSIAVFSSWVLGGDNVEFWYPVERLVVGNLISQYVVVDQFNLSNLLYGATLPSWFTFGWHEQFLLDVWAWKEIFGWSIGESFYAAPSSFVAEAHANFHAFGVVFNSFFLFTVLRGIDYLICKIKSHTIFTALIVYSSLRFANISTTGMFSYFADYHYCAVILFALILLEDKGRSRSTLPTMSAWR